MRFKGLDLNLLIALDALLDEKSVSKAAERLHLSQPAMSAALGRIREYFKDPILKLHGKTMVPTLHALKIHDELKDLLSNVDTLISKTTSFDPATSARKFKITASDYMAQVILAPLVVDLQSSAPGIKLEIVPPADSTHTLVSQGQLDVVFLPEQMLSDSLPAEFLFEERFVLVGCETNPIMQKKVTEEAFYAAGHVAVQLGRLRPQSITEQALEARRKDRNTDIIVTSFLLAPEMIVGTDRLMVMHERLAKIFAKRIPIAIGEIPFSFPPLKEYLQYHETRADDPGLRWLIDKIKTHIS